jgi:MFS family permease/HAMP domain-containing protein
MLPDLPGPGSETGSRTEVAGFINSTFPIEADGRVATVLHVGVSGEYVRGRLSELLYEAITVIVVSLLVTLEFLMFLMSVRVSGPLERIETMLTDGARGMFGNHLAMRARDEIGDLVTALNRALRNLRQRYEDFQFDVREIKDAQIDKSIVNRIQAACQPVDDRYRFTGGTELRPRNAMQIRVPLFLFMFAEELPRSFLPLFIAQLSPTDSVISDELLFGLPITLFMLAGMIVVPLGGGLADRFGARRVFLAGVIPATIGYFGTFLAQGYYELVGWRILSGIGYGLIFIAAQAWVAANTDARNRAQGMTVFVGGVFAATICGPSIGGIFADRIGFESTFLISAGLAVVSGLLVYAMLDATVKRRTTHRSTFGGQEWRALLSDSRLFSVTVFAAIPGKLILAGFLFYLVPLYLSELGNRQSVIGWMIMLYGVSTLACMPFAARFADRSGRHAAVVAAGGVVAGLGCLASLSEASVGGPSGAVMIAILALGFGHALSLTSQIAIVQEVASYHGGLGQASVIGAYRLVERAGMVLGPIVAGALAASFGYQGAIVGIGIIVLVSIALYMIMMHLSRSASAARRSKLA